jgi:hypothetical protein
MSTYQKDWFAAQKNGEKNHSNRKYNVKLNENNNMYARINNNNSIETKKVLENNMKPVVANDRAPEIEAKVESVKTEEANKYKSNGSNDSGGSVLNMFKIQNASRMFDSSYNGSPQQMNKTNTSSLENSTAKSASVENSTKIHANTNTDTQANYKNNYYSYQPTTMHHYQHHNNQQPVNSSKKKFFAKGSNKNSSSSMTNGNSVPQQQNKIQAHANAKAKNTQNGTTNEIIDFTDKSSELFPALSEAMALTKKQSNPSIIAKPNATPVVSVTSPSLNGCGPPRSAAKSTSPIKLTSPQTYSQDFLYYVGMQMANRLSMPPPQYTHSPQNAASNLLHSASNLLVQASNYNNLQTELNAKKNLFFEQTLNAIDKSAAHNKEKDRPIGNYQNFNNLLPYIHDRGYDAYENSVKNQLQQQQQQQRMINKQQDDCFYQNNSNFNYHMHHTNPANSLQNASRTGGYNNHNNNNNKKQYNYNNYNNGKKGQQVSYNYNNKYQNNNHNSNFNRHVNFNQNIGESRMFNLIKLKMFIVFMIVIPRNINLHTLHMTSK